ncbi:hypothetical protein BH09BAC6_BH09BAC6_10130 [soil metagenome]|jgi:hypothetical protein
MSIIFNAGQAIEWTLRLAAVYILLDSAGKLYHYKEFKDDGISSWKYFRTNRYFTSRGKTFTHILDVIFEYRAWLYILTLRLLSALYLLFLPQQNMASTLCLLILFIAGGLVNLRNGAFGAETENRLGLMIVGALLLHCLVPTPLITHITLWFIAIQSCLSYLTAGMVKLLDKEWRNGNGIFNVVNSPNLMVWDKPAFFFKRYPAPGKFLTWATIVMECTFPLVLIIGSPAFVLFLIWGILFHSAIATLLGLNKFFWVWIATYPAIIYIAQR